MDVEYWAIYDERTCCYCGRWSYPQINLFGFANHCSLCPGEHTHPLKSLREKLMMLVFLLATHILLTLCSPWRPNVSRAVHHLAEPYWKTCSALQYWPRMGFPDSLHALQSIDWYLSCWHVPTIPHLALSHDLAWTVLNHIALLCPSRWEENGPRESKRLEDISVSMVCLSNRSILHLLLDSRCSLAGPFGVCVCYMWAQNVKSRDWLSKLTQQIGIKPNNIIINQLFGGFQGLSLIPITFDWTYVSGYLGDPILAPTFAHINTLIGLIAFVIITTIGISYSGAL